MEVGSEKIIIDYSKLVDAYGFMLSNKETVIVHNKNLTGCKPSSNKIIFRNLMLHRVNNEVYNVTCRR